LGNDKYTSLTSISLAEEEEIQALESFLKESGRVQGTRSGSTSGKHSLSAKHHTLQYPFNSSDLMKKRLKKQSEKE
jgi:hypothetical protein